MEKNEKGNILLEEHIRKIKHRIGYQISETPRYRPLVGDSEIFDQAPVLTNEAGEQEDAEKPGGGEMPPAPTNDQPMNADAPGAPPTPAFDKAGGETMPPPGGMDDPSMGMPPTEPAPEVDDVQNDIIKHNIEAMKSIHDELEMLSSTVNQLNSKIDTLNADVEEVREPTNSEKLMNKTKVSYPYYFNLNDLWSDNWFNQQRSANNEKGINQLPDGTFVADFDDLPQKSKMDVQDSFNDMV
ncbi:MAG: hypothetical protein WC333_00930 [Dehalococcoidia bacterium]|jgi:hypothetical protein